MTMLWNHLEVRERGSGRLVAEFTATDGDRIDVAYSTRHGRPWSRITAWRSGTGEQIGGTVFDRILDHQELQTMSSHSLVLSGWLLPGTNPALVGDDPADDEQQLLEVYVALRRRDLLAAAPAPEASATA